MRTIAKTFVTLALLLAIVLGAYYGYRRSLAKKAGEEYPVSRTPADLVREIAGLFDRGEEEGPRRPRPSRETVPAEEEPAAPPPADPARLEKARELYEAGEFRQAIPVLLEVIAVPGATAERPREMLARANLFLLLLEGTERGAGLGGDAIARVETAGGETMYVTVTDETEDEITFSKEGGISVRVPKRSLKSLDVARSPDRKTYLFEMDYREKLAAAATAGDYLALARECWRNGLSHHVTYLLEQALATPGEALEEVVASRHGDAERARAAEREAFTRDLLIHFWPRGEYTGRAIAGMAKGPGLSPTAPAAGDPEGGEPPSGIGGSVARTPRGSDPALNDLLDQADRQREIAEEHYRKAQPGSPDIATHRKKAIAAYRKAIELYERVNENWDVKLDSTFRELQTHLYHMLKDTPVR